MGREMLSESLEELGMDLGSVQKLCNAIFGADDPSSSAIAKSSLGSLPEWAQTGARTESRSNGHVDEENDSDSDDGLELEANVGDLKLEGNDQTSAAVSADEPEEIILEENREAPISTAPAPSAGAVGSGPEGTSGRISEATRRVAERVKTQGNEALKAGKFAEAADLYGQAIVLDPSNAIYLANRSHAYASLARYERALEDASRAVELKPDYLKAHLRRGTALSGLARHADAALAYEEALRVEMTAQERNQVETLRVKAVEMAKLEAEFAADCFDWLSELNESVLPNTFFERSLDDNDDNAMVFEYRDALQEALAEMRHLEGSLVLRTKQGVSFDIVEVLATSFESLMLRAERRSNSLTKQMGPVTVRVRHLMHDWRDGALDNTVAEKMWERSTAEHQRLEKLAGSRHWVTLAADVASETKGYVGGVEYPCLFVEHFPGKDLSELISVAGVGGPVGRRMHEELDEDDEEGTYGMAKQKVTPAALEKDLVAIKTMVLGAMQAMKDAFDAGFYYKSDGKDGPFLGDLLIHDGKVKMVDVLNLSEREEGDGVTFTMVPLVVSAIGEYVRRWWLQTAELMGIDPHHPRKVQADLQAVLDNFGTLNWILFDWPKEQLRGDKILDLVINGPQQPAPAVDPTVQRHWDDFLSRSFVMLGPRRFDEIKAMTNELNQGELTMKDLINRSRYVMGTDFEGLHLEYLDILKQLGHQVGK